MSFLVALGVFFLSFIAHIVLHRVRSRRSMTSACVYCGGFVLLVVITQDMSLPYPISSLVLYSLLSLFASYLYVGVLLGGETPSSMILLALKKRSVVSESELCALFSREKLLEKRIDDLISSGLVTKDREGRLFVTKKGEGMMVFVYLYRTIFARATGG